MLYRAVLRRAKTQCQHQHQHQYQYQHQHQYQYNARVLLYCNTHYAAQTKKATALHLIVNIRQRKY